MNKIGVTLKINYFNQVFLVQKLRHLSCKLYSKCLINIWGLHENDYTLPENFERLKAENQIAQYIL